MDSFEPPPIAELVPHRGEILLLDRVLAHDANTTTARVGIAKQSWLKREDGSVGAWLALEYMAQCAALHEGLQARAEGRPVEWGFLVSAMGLQLHCGHFEGTRELTVVAHRRRGRPGLGGFSYDCSVRDEEETLLAEGRLSISLTRPGGS